jgi:integration host factor subunit beta
MERPGKRPAVTVDHSSSAAQPDPAPTRRRKPSQRSAGAGVTVTKKDLVNRIAERTGETKVVTKNVIQMFLDEIIAELGAGNRLEFRDFGVFEVRPRRARRAQNPRTLEKVSVPPKNVVKFKVGRIMRERVTDDEAPVRGRPR